MAAKRARRATPRGHTGRTPKGYTRDVRIERMGCVTIYKRGRAYHLYYREFGKTLRRRVPGNLASARIAASKVNAALGEGRPSPFGYDRIKPEHFVAGYLDHCENVAGLAMRTVDRYRAALTHFKEFAMAKGISFIDQVNPRTVDDFVKWLRGQKRTRNGAKTGKAVEYTDPGILFILSACRTSFNWARRHQHLPPFAESPFSSETVDKLQRRARNGQPERVFSEKEMESFLEACDDWQRPIFVVLAAYGLRVGELTHLLIEDVDFDKHVLTIRSKPELCWHVKTSKERRLPIFPEIRSIFERLIADRKAGFLFLNRNFAEGQLEPAALFENSKALKAHLLQLAEDPRSEGSSDKDIRRDVTIFLRDLGQIPEKRVRQEFMRITVKIECPEMTRVHSLRHLFATRAQEAGMNPFRCFRHQLLAACP